MAIKLGNPTIRPAMVMDGLHVDQLLLRIDRKSGVKTINAQAVIYGVDDQGKQVYSDTDIKVAEGDFSARAVEWAITHGQATDVADAIAKLTVAKQTVSEAHPSIFELMAYFEQATGIIFEIAGKVDMVGLE